jgi:hypothetical protein
MYKINLNNTLEFINLMKLHLNEEDQMVAKCHFPVLFVMWVFKIFKFEWASTNHTNNRADRKPIQSQSKANRKPIEMHTSAPAQTNPSYSEA